MTDDLDTVIWQTLNLLQARLQRLDYLITGNVSLDGYNTGSKTSEEGKAGKVQNVTEGLRSLDASLRKLTANSDAVKQILSLRKKHPQLLLPPRAFHYYGQEASSSEKTAQQEREAQYSDPPTPPSSTIAYRLGSILASEDLFQSTSSQLTNLQDLHVPPTAPLADLVALQPRLDRIRLRQVAQAAEVDWLAKWSGVLLMRWYDGSVIGVGRSWVDWEQRLMGMERDVRRGEVKAGIELKDDGSESDEGDEEDEDEGGSGDDDEEDVEDVEDGGEEEDEDEDDNNDEDEDDDDEDEDENENSGSSGE